MTAADQTPEAVAFKRRIVRPIDPTAPIWVSEKDIPADTGWSEYDLARAARFELVAKHRKLNAERAKVVRDMENAKHDYPARAAEALRAGDKAPADPMPKLTAKLEQLDKDLDVMRHALQQDADELEALVHANRETWHALNVDLRATAIAEAEDALAVLVGACDRLHRVRAQDNWLMGDKFTAPTLGSDELNKLADMIDKAGRDQQLVYVTQAAFRKLRAGEDVTAIDGTPVPRDTPLSAVKISHSRPSRVVEDLSMIQTEGGVG